MVLAFGIMLLFSCTAIISPLHGLGLWLFLMITHGLFYQYLGSSAVHLPLYFGILLVIVIVVRHHWSGISLPLIILVSTLLVLMAISGLFGINQNTSFFSILLFSKGFLLLIVLAGALRNEQEVKVMTLYCLAGLLVGAVFAIYQKLTGTYAINTLYVQRAATLRGDPNDTAMLLVAGLPLCLYWMSSVKNKAVRVAAMSTLAALLTGIVLTGSRGGFVALLLVSLAIIFRRPSMRLVAYGIIGAVLMAMLAPQNYWDRMKTIVTGNEHHLGHSIENRAQLQHIGLEIVYNNPLLGVGPGNFGQAYSNLVMSKSLTGKFKRSSSQEKTVSAAHNMYLEFFAENGLIGGFVLLVVMVLSLRNLLRNDGTTKIASNQLGFGYSLALSLGGMLFAGLFLSQAKNSVLWFMLGIGYAMGAIRWRNFMASDENEQNSVEQIATPF